MPGIDLLGKFILHNTTTVVCSLFFIMTIKDI